MNPKKFYKEYLVDGDSKLKLHKIDCDGNKQAGWSKKDALEQTEKNLERIELSQALLSAENKRSVLLVFQAMDAGGKDGTVKMLGRPLNPAGCTVTSFKAPTEEERAHDFLWRVEKVCPRKGDIAIFNRSHYEGTRRCEREIVASSSSSSCTD
jgi:polyphosphate kinase 2 (PPK2 family)